MTGKVRRRPGGQLGSYIGRTFRMAALAIVTAAAMPWPKGAQAEVGEVRLARQYGIAHLQMTIMEELKLVEKHAADEGLKDLEVSWQRFSGGPAMNEALLSGNIQFASGGLTSLIVIWDKSKGSYIGLAALNSMPMILTTRDPDVKTVRDFTDKDRIAVPAVRVSPQAIVLQMAAAQAFGPDEYTKLDPLTVSLPHPDAAAAMLSGRTEITAHFTAAPYSYEELQNPAIRRVLSSNDILGGPATFGVVWGAKRFMTENPKITRAVLAAIEDATRLIKDEPRRAAGLYIRADRVKLDPAFVEKMLRDPENIFTTTPQNVMEFADFMARTGSIRQKPHDWKDLFSPLIGSQPGS